MANLKEKEIHLILKTLRKNTGIINCSVFTEDGFLVAMDQDGININEDYQLSLGAISANTLALAQEAIGILKTNHYIKQFVIQAGDQLDDDGFTIILKTITSETFLLIIFPISLNLGVIFFELNQTMQKLINYISGIERQDSLEGIRMTYTL